MAHTHQVRFEWNPAKDRENRRKHGLTFAEAKELFLSDADVLEIFDEAHSETEERFISVGPIQRGLVIVVWTEPRDELVRIISARFASQEETRLYRKHLGAKR